MAPPPKGNRVQIKFRATESLRTKMHALAALHERVANDEFMAAAERYATHHDPKTCALCIDLHQRREKA